MHDKNPSQKHIKQTSNTRTLNPITKNKNSFHCKNQSSLDTPPVRQRANRTQHELRSRNHEALGTVDWNRTSRKHPRAEKNFGDRIEAGNAA
jgi:hypothetical protein